MAPMAELIFPLLTRFLRVSIPNVAPCSSARATSEASLLRCTAGSGAAGFACCPPADSSTNCLAISATPGSGCLPGKKDPDGSYSPGTLYVVAGPGAGLSG